MRPKQVMFDHIGIIGGIRCFCECGNKLQDIPKTNNGPTDPAREPDILMGKNIWRPKP